MSQMYLAKLLFYSLNFLGNLFDYLYIFLKIYRILCFAKITFDQIPLYNPYQWPLSFIRVITRPYMVFWGKLLPNLKLGTMTYEIASIVALEFLASLVKFAFYIRIFLYSQIGKLAEFIK